MIIKELEKIIQRYRYIPHVEIELRFGWNQHINNFKTFDTNIQERYFTPLLNVIKESYTEKKVFSKHHVYNSSVFVDPVSNARVVRHSNNYVEAHIKTKIEVVDFEIEGTPFDIRICVSIEEPFREYIDFSRLVPIRTRQRDTFVYKMWNYDLTSSIYNEPVNNVKQVYEFEIELDCYNANNNGDISSLYLSNSLVLKLQDIVKMKLADNEKIHLKNYRLVSNKVYNQRIHKQCL